MLNEDAWALLDRLTRWLGQFKVCFGHRAQRVSLRQYVQGLLGDSRRKTMAGMLARVTEPSSYQAFHHFVTHAPWDAAMVWRRLREVLPERRGVLILDDTDFLKQGTQSVGVTRQYSGTHRRVANCQVAVTAALWNGVRGWLVGTELFLPPEWLEPARRTDARIPAGRRFQEKWRLGLTLIRQGQAAGLEITAVVADASYGDVAALRTAIDRLHLVYVMAVSNDTTVFRGEPTIAPPRVRRGPGAPFTRPRLRRDPPALSVVEVAQTLPRRAWRRVTWRNGTNAPCRAEFAAVRVSPVVAWRRDRCIQPCWLLCERAIGDRTPHRYHFSNMPADATLTRLARTAHQRWAIEQQYREFKTELGLDHFEGRSYPGWCHHVVLTAVAHAFLQRERMRPDPAPTLTLPQVHAIVQEIFTGLLFVTRRRYLAWLNQAKVRYVPLRI